MSWNANCLKALSKAGLFQSPGHESRFNELIYCFSDKPFFTKGLCKCMYLSAWDDEHFAIMLETLNEMTLGQEKNTGEMLDKGDSIATTQTGGEYYIYQMSLAFLAEKPFRLEEGVTLDPEHQYIYDRATIASQIIDQV